MIISCLAINLIFAGIYPSAAWALPEGPTQPEFNSFTPIGASDMVDLTSGDFNYSIPVMDVGGYPLSLGYSSSTNFDSPSSWVGHGWDLSAGQINRSMRVVPDDFDGTDKIKTKNNKRPEETYVLGANIHPSVSGNDALIPVQLNLGLALEYNNYRGLSVLPSLGIALNIHNKLSPSLNFAPTSANGVSIGGNLGISAIPGLTLGAGFNYNSFQGFQGLNTSITSNVSVPFKQRNVNASGSFTSRLDLGAPKSFTPAYNLGLTNFLGRFEVGSGTKYLIFGAQAEVYASVAVQQIRDSYIERSFSAFGYNNNYMNAGDGMLDFTRSFDRPVNANTSVLPVPQHMFDMYNISGQGLSGSFKPMKSQVDYVFDPFVRNASNDIRGGFDFLAGPDGVGVAVETSGSFSNSESGKWPESGFQSHLDPVNVDLLNPNFKRLYFKMVGENSLKNDLTVTDEYITEIGGKSPVNFGLASNKDINWGKYKKSPSSEGSVALTEKIVQEDRIPTGKSIQSISVSELQDYNSDLSSANNEYANLNKVFLNTNSKDHHQAGFRITDESGSIYNYIQPLYNLKNINNSFSVGSTNLTFDNSQIRYDNSDPTTSNNKGQDHSVQRKEIPAYVHTSLIKSVLSSDYRDRKGDGASPDDLGSYTLFTYKKSTTLSKFRTPVQSNTANFNEGLNSLKGDNKASYNYGEKEQAFLDRIITKTHVAFFELNNPITEKREDNLAPIDENGGVNNSSDSRSRYLKRIYLYSLKQAEQIGLLDNTNFNPAAAAAAHPGIKPLKTAHFDYDYSLQSKSGNNIGLPNSVSNNGKLTLKKVFFTYGSSEMGRYTPYEFEYNQDSNFNYHPMNKDVWGNYKPFEGSNALTDVASNTEFPYTPQDKQLTDGATKADQLAQKFLLSKIKLPSGGNINIDYESDDYAYVQDQKNMQMFRIAGAGYDKSIANSDVSNTSVQLYNNTLGAKQYLYLELDKNSFEDSSLSNNDYLEEFREEYLDDLMDEPLFFKTLMNVHSGGFNEYISGYIYLEDPGSISNSNFNLIANKLYVAIPIKLPTLNGRNNGGSAHPFSKATWLYGRHYMPEVAFNGRELSADLGSIGSVVRRAADTFESLLEMFRSPNSLLREGGSGEIMYTNKSWLRLREPSGFKKGGGARVNSISVNSNWDLMTGSSNSDIEPKYGQDYSYVSENGLFSSGVATFEPHLSEENPFMLPFEDRGRKVAGLGSDNFSSLIDKFLAPASSNYVNGPIMKDYYPNPSITYSRVTVKNHKPENPDATSSFTLDEKATGKVVHKFYTSRDFPTIQKNSVLDIITPPRSTLDFAADLIGVPSNIVQTERLIASQAFYVETNDMNGKPKSQSVYKEGASDDQFITKTEYKYQVDEDGLNNQVLQIDKKGNIVQQEVGVEYDVINDFRYSESSSFSAGMDANIYFTALPLPPFLFVTGFGMPNISNFNSQMRSVATAKHVHRTGILKSTTLYDRESKISTEHLAYDYYSRKPIITQVNNEFNDVIYNMDIPSHWVHDEMGNSSFNDGMVFELTYANNRYNFKNGATNTLGEKLINLDSGLQYLINGDEIRSFSNGDSFWVDSVDLLTGSLDLINKAGEYIDNSTLGGTQKFKVVRSAYDNKQAQAISSISLSRNPIRDLTTGALLNKLPITSDTNSNFAFNESYQVYNASSIEMSDRWDPACECGFEEIEEDSIGPIYNDPAGQFINPYFNNLKGQYRPIKSYAFLTGRDSDNEEKPILRTDGFYSDFVPFYNINNQTGKWEATGKEYQSTISGRNSWTFASQVSKISPYGLELENKDPLDTPRFSSAMYGFNKKFPTAVASNTEYRELAFDSFEDYDYIEHSGEEHFDFTNALHQTVNADDEYISDVSNFFDIKFHLTDQAAHTGKTSLVLRGGERYGIEKSMKPCPKGNPGDALRRILNYLWMNRELYEDGSCIDEPSDLFAVPGFNDLRPFIVNNPEGGIPIICNIIIDEERGIFFDFYSNLEFNQGINSLELKNDINFVFESFSPFDCGENAPLENVVLGNNDPYNFSQASFNFDAECNYDEEEKFSLYHRMIELDDYCIDCTSFSPHSNKEYYVSAWVNQFGNYLNETTPEGLRDEQPVTYEDVKLIVSFYDSNQNQLQSFRFKPEGKIINGWQKLSGRFIAGDDAYVMKVIVENSNLNSASLLDDLRIHPINGSMKSFVYDKNNFRLRAELDDNNYSTFYEYDMEGNLIRIKKETSRGIMTIQESRQGMSKLSN
ncbi:hypothetical protein [Nonlabens xylanidelens]|nr:hypothetical protein [Nonlabens xylanidelens]